MQSVIGARVTVNFENAGKLLINSDAVTLETIEDPSVPGKPPDGRHAP